MTAVDAYLFANMEVVLNVATYGGYLIGVAASAVLFMVGMKYVKEIRGAA